MIQKILFVGHCVLNTASKVVMYNEKEMAQEEQLRQKVVLSALSNGIQLVQLPCPEFLLYGSRRWGHTSDQFNNPFFRSCCRKQLEPILLQLEEYLGHPERFHVLGILGIDGSPSCGVDYTCKGSWGGNLSSRDNLGHIIEDVSLVSGRGVFMEELWSELCRRNINLPMVGMFAPEPDKALDLLEEAATPL